MFCVLDHGAPVAVFAVSYDDSALWGSRERGEHLYLHRIAKSGTTQVPGLLDFILHWAREHCKTLSRSGLRMDTWARNTPLISLYQSRGFRVVDRIHVERDSRLPAQYQRNDFVLLEEEE